MSIEQTIPTTPDASACCDSSCCGGAKSVTGPELHTATPLAHPVAPAADVRSTIRDKYAAVASGGSCGCGCCGGEPGDEAALGALGYTDEQRAAIPAGADLGLGCGNPIAHAGLVAGETVLDLGSGGGIDCFLAAREVGPGGHVIGVDMTPAMVERARANRARVQAANVEFRLGEIEHLPVADASVDVIISNCVVNLSPDKPRVFREAARVLRPGGRLVVSDLVLTRELSPELRRTVDQTVGCVAGALVRDEYLGVIRDAGFDDVQLVAERGYAVGLDGLPSGSPEHEAFAAVTSIQVRATKQFAVRA
jgi:arsenite methyltransferase